MFANFSLKMTEMINQLSKYQNSGSVSVDLIDYSAKKKMHMFQMCLFYWLLYILTHDPQLSSHYIE